jgi:hypothetical protein
MSFGGFRLLGVLGLLALVLGTAGQAGASERAPLPAPVPHGPFKVSAAHYDGRVLTLRVLVPDSGTLLIGVPIACRHGRVKNCHRRTTVVTHPTEAGGLTVRKTLPLRPPSTHEVTLSLRLYQPSGALTWTTSTVTVHSTTK